MENQGALSESVQQSATGVNKPSIVYLFLKRIIDIVGGVIGLLIFSPVFILIPILYMRGDNKGPVFFKQVRIGKNGKVFHIYKFRSMVVNAEQK